MYNEQFKFKNRKNKEPQILLIILFYLFSKQKYTIRYWDFRIEQIYRLFRSFPSEIHNKSSKIKNT